MKALIVLTFSSWGGYIPENMNGRLEDRGDWQLLMVFLLIVYLSNSSLFRVTASTMASHNPLRIISREYSVRALLLICIATRNTLVAS